MKTRIILKVDIPALGHTGEIVEVATGHARNYLIPTGQAMPFSEDGMLRIEKARKEAEVARAALLEQHASLAQRLEGVQITFEERANEEGHLYGAVTSKTIGEALAAQGIELTESQIRLAEPIRDVGEYEVPIHVHAEIKGEIKVWVVAQQEAEAEGEAPAAAQTEA